MSPVILTHFYNEEYLLPWWLEHHKKYFPFGICVDYGSTDRSVEIIKKICPHYEIFPSKFGHFDSHLLEYEMMYYERQVQGWRISIPVTEFLVGNLNTLMSNTTERKQWIIPSLIFGEFNPSGYLDPNKKLWEQIFNGCHYQNTQIPRAWQCRSLHNYNDIFYMPGRHYSNENTDLAMIFKYSNVLVGEPMIKRKLQIQTKISDYDKKNHNAPTHNGMDNDGLTIYNLLDNFKRVVGDTTDLRETMNSVLKYI